MVKGCVYMSALQLSQRRVLAQEKSQVQGALFGLDWLKLQQLLNCCWVELLGRI